MHGSRIANHKNGTQSTGNIVRNNIANQIVLENAGVGIQDHNLIFNRNIIVAIMK